MGVSLHMYQHVIVYINYQKKDDTCSVNLICIYCTAIIEQFYFTEKRANIVRLSTVFICKSSGHTLVVTQL